MGLVLHISTMHFNFVKCMINIISISVPIKLLRPECNLRKSNVDRMYARSIVVDAHDIETLFGHEQVTFLSCDDKAQ